MKKAPRNNKSIHASNSEINVLQGFSNIARDDVKNLTVSIADIDYAIKFHIKETIKPIVADNGNFVQVPIIFANGEKWALIQRHGYMRDNQNKILAPLIALRRTNISKRQDLPDLKILETVGARILVKRDFNPATVLEKYSKTGKKPSSTYYSIDIPTYVDVSYELFIQAQDQLQLNSIIEQLMWFDKKAFGNTFKFHCFFDAYTNEVSNTIGEDRTVTSNIGLLVKGYILNPKSPSAPTIYKVNPISKLVIGMETDFSESEQLNANLGTVVSTNNVNSANSSSPSLSAAILYSNVNKQLQGTVISNSTCTFPAGWLVAPTPLPSTSIDNFVFYCNGVFIEKTAIVSFTSTATMSTLQVDTNQLGFNLANDDEIIAIGKFK